MGEVDAVKTQNYQKAYILFQDKKNVFEYIAFNKMVTKKNFSLSYFFLKDIKHTN